MKKKLTTNSSLINVRHGRMGAVLLAIFLGGSALAQTPAPELVAAAAPAGAMISVVSSTERGQQVHLMVGHIAFLDALTRVHRIYISDPEVIESHAISPKQIVLTAKAPGTSTVVLWDESDRQQTYTVSSDLDTQDLVNSLHNALPGESITVQASGSRIMLAGTVSTPAAAEQAGKLASFFSKDVLNSLLVNPARIKQVRLDVRFVEVDRSKVKQFGINLFNPGGSGTTIASSTTQQFASSLSLTASSSGSSSGSGAGGTVGGYTLSVSNPLNFLFYNSKLNLGAVIQDLADKQVLQILSEPSITTLSGEKASFLAGGEFPFPVIQGSSGGLTSITIQFRPYGVRLEFTPSVGPDGNIALKIAPEVSALDYTNAVTISGYTIPALSTKHAETQVVLRSGESFAISGLLDKRTTDAFSQTPGIASVPILGALFKSKNLSTSTTELVVIVTPTVVDPLNLPSGPIAEPKAVRPFLDQKKFDNSVAEKH